MVNSLISKGNSGDSGLNLEARKAFGELAQSPDLPMGILGRSCDRCLGFDFGSMKQVMQQRFFSQEGSLATFLHYNIFS
jgi:hypothetical protein